MMTTDIAAEQKTTDPQWVRAIDTLSKTCGYLAALVTLALLATVVTDVSGRTLFNTPFNGTLEYVTYWWMPSLVFLALGMAQLRNEHIQVTLLLDAVPPSMRRLVSSLCLLVAAAVTVMFVYFMWLGAQSSAAIREAALGTAVVPIWPFKFVAVFGLAVFGLQLLASVYRTWTRPLAELATADSLDIQDSVI